MINKLKLLVGVLFLVGFFTFPSQILAEKKINYDCEWSVNDDKLLFCVGTDTLEELKKARVVLGCVNNCGSILDWIGREVSDFGNLSTYGTRPDGRAFSCVGGADFGIRLTNHIKECLAEGKTESQCAPKLKGTAESGIAGWTGFCKDTTVFNGENITDPSSYGSSSFELCNQVPPDKQDDCNACVIDGEDPRGIWTAVGCIPTSKESIIRTIITIGLGVAGGIALLLILVSSFMLTVSQGDPQKITEAKEQLTAAIIGLFFIIFSVTILQFIGVKVFNIPGFGQ